jgi:hypothetical protein
MCILHDEAHARREPAEPMFRTVTSRLFLLLRDGQTATWTSATDR